MWILLVLSVVLLLSMLAVSGQVLAIEAVDDTETVMWNQPEAVGFECLVTVNRTELNEDTSISLKIITNNPVFGRLFMPLDMLGCQSKSVLLFPANTTIGSLDLQLANSTQSGNLLSLSWTVCYAARNVGDDLIWFQCQSEAIRSPLGSVKVSIVSDQRMPATFLSMVPFVFLLTIVLLCNVFIWKRMFRRRMQYQASQAAVAAARASALQATLNHQGTAGLSPQAIALIPVEKVIAGDGLEKELCVICQSEFEPEESFKRLRCTHVFHAECIDAWLVKSCVCPICITDIVIV